MNFPSAFKIIFFLFILKLLKPLEGFVGTQHFQISSYGVVQRDNKRGFIEDRFMLTEVAQIVTRIKKYCPPPQSINAALNLQYYSEKNPLFSTLDHFRKTYGERRCHLGDLGFRCARHFYHYVLGTSLTNVDCKSHISLEKRAKMAFYTRKAAKIYTRERSILISRYLCDLYDGIRHLYHHGTWSGDGLTWEEVYFKYENTVLQQMPDLEGDELAFRVYLKILEKSHQTNQIFDKLLLPSGFVPDILNSFWDYVRRNGYSSTARAQIDC
mmetsp:Transcript_27358/g.35522  ORF Transcript_27358/g.35522 Transcript_27358/m.35522 type:complete len:269 (+) Transcript_27358:119-925(+)